VKEDHWCTVHTKHGKPPQTTFPQRHGNQQHGRTDALAILGWAAGQKLEGEIED